MPPELDQPAIEVTTDAAISALLCLFHNYAMKRQQGFPSPRLSQRIYYHLEGLSQRDDVPEFQRRTCDELSDAWLPVLDRQQSHV